ncbi:MAG TPA: TIR-like protein FxsC [Trebonia sp.]|nr:TIR-like protein FxsC [Trebonia sp.]
MSSREQRAQDAGSLHIRPYFFLSYARTPKRDLADRENPDRWVHKLYKDLCDEILQMTDVQPSEAGFMDTENKLGAEWSPELMNALKNCRTFVPLYSRRYFESDNCGREWFAFARREITHQARGGERADAIVPALWTRLDRGSIPAIAQLVQYEHPELGERYRTDGFYGLMKMHNYRAAYQRAVHRLAERIIEIGDRSVAHGDRDVQRMDRADFEALPSAFGPASAKRTTSGQLQISVLAHDTSSLPQGRASAYYGATPHSWSPYQPNYPQPVAEYALELARKCLDCDPLVESFRGFRADAAASNVPPGICLVDAWVTMSDAYHERLRQLDGITVPWLSVLVPWNCEDHGLSAEENMIRAKLEEHLGRKLAGVPRRCRMAADGIPTIHDLAQVLPEMAMIMLKRYHKNAPAPSIPGPVLPRPRLRSADPGEPGGTE